MKLDPGSLFDENYYRKQLARSTSKNLLEDFLHDGWRKNLDPHPLFRTAYYRERARSGDRNPLEHYLENGAADFDLNPSPLFDTRYYLTQVPPEELGGLPPLLHYLQGGHDHVSPSPYFDPNYRKFVISRSKRPLERHVRHPASQPGNPAFHARLYRNWHPDYQGSRLTALEHWASRPEHHARLVNMDWLLARQHHGEKWTGLSRPPFHDNDAITLNTDNPYVTALHASHVRPIESFPKSDRARIVFLCQNWNLSGVNRWVQHLAEGLAAKGWPVVVLITENRIPLSEEKDLPNVDVRILPHTPGIRQTLWEQTRDFLVAASPCLVLTAYEWNANAIAPALPDNVGFVNVLHSDEARYYEQARRLSPYVNAFVAVSNRIRQTLASDKAETIPYGVTPPAVRAEAATEQPIRLLYTGRLARRQKRALDFIPLVRELRRRRVNFHLTLAGDGHDARKLHRRLRKDVREGFVTFTGHVNEAEVARLLGASQIFLLMSDYEGLPLSLLEAMAHGLVPVVSDIPSGVPDLVQEGETGFRNPIGDIAAFADRIEFLRDHPAEWRRLSDAAAALIATRFSVERMTSSYDNLLTRLAEEKFARPICPPSPIRNVLPEGNPTEHPDKTRHPRWFHKKT